MHYPIVLCLLSIARAIAHKASKIWGSQKKTWAVYKMELGGQLSCTLAAIVSEATAVVLLEMLWLKKRVACSMCGAMLL